MNIKLRNNFQLREYIKNEFAQNNSAINFFIWMWKFR